MLNSFCSMPGTRRKGGKSQIITHTQITDLFAKKQKKAKLWALFLNENAEKLHK